MPDASHSRQRAKAYVGEHLGALTQRIDGPSWVYFAGHLLTTAFTAYLLWLSDGSFVWPLALLLHGVALVHWLHPFTRRLILQCSNHAN